MTRVGFRSSSKGAKRFLSNLFGGAEFDYMSNRTLNTTNEASDVPVSNKKLHALYQYLRGIDWDNQYDLFRRYRTLLQPSCLGNYARGPGHERVYRDPYRKDGKVAGGLIAKLISGCWRPNMGPRLAVVNLIADEIVHDINKRADGKALRQRFPGLFLTNEDDTPVSIVRESFMDGTAEERTRAMEKALRRKFIRDPGDEDQKFTPMYQDILLSIPCDVYELSGRQTQGVWTGTDGLLGKLLGRIRSELRSEPSVCEHSNLLKRARIGT